LSSRPEKNQRIYLCGKISKKPDFKEIFANHEKRWRDEGYATVINPVTLVGERPANMTEESFWRQCMVTCFMSIMFHTDVIAIIPPDWETSPGANHEIYLATMLGIKLYNVETFERLHLGIKYRTIFGGSGIHKDSDYDDLLRYFKQVVESSNSFLDPFVTGQRSAQPEPRFTP